MRLIVSLMCLGLLTANGVSRAQQPPAPAPTAQTPAAQPPPPPPPEAQGPAETASERATRYSRFSAGSGGMLLVFTELLSGLVTGAILGNTFESRNGDYVGAVLGGLTLGTAAEPTRYPPTLPGQRLRSSETFQAAPVPVLMRTGRRGESLTAGPGVLLRF